VVVIEKVFFDRMKRTETIVKEWGGMVDRNIPTERIEVGFCLSLILHLTRVEQLLA